MLTHAVLHSDETRGLSAGQHRPEGLTLSLSGWKCLLAGREMQHWTEPPWTPLLLSPQTHFELR
jgi:hypothetical protein